MNLGFNYLFCVFVNVLRVEGQVREKSLLLQYDDLDKDVEVLALMDCLMLTVRMALSISSGAEKED